MRSAFRTRAAFAMLTLAGIASFTRSQAPARLGPPISAAQPAHALAPARDEGPVLPPRSSLATISPSSIIRADHTVVDPSSNAAVPLTLPNTLRLALLVNLNIRVSEEVVNQARAAILRADVAWVPNLSLGSSYNHHEGNIQKTEGNVIKANRDSLFVGGAPSLTLQLSDAIFAPLLARRLADANLAALQRVNNETFQRVADAYLNILRFRRRLARIDETLEYLTSTRDSPMRAGSKGLLPLVKDFVDVGRKEALRSDLTRVEVEILRRQEERRGALLDFALAQAELARILRLDPRTPLWPGEDFRVPIPIPIGEWGTQPIEALVTIALQSRPELAESQALVQAAVQRVSMARSRPFLPNISLAYNYGGFGGGPDPNPSIITPPAKPGQAPKVTAQPGFGPSGRILHFGNRTDFDAAIYWRFQNFGIGDYAEVRQQEAAQRQAMLRLIQAQDRVATQVVQAFEQLGGWKDRLDVTRSALFDEKGQPTGPVFKSIQLNFDRIRGAEGRPLEVLDSIRSLSDALEAYGQAVTEYERSQFRLLIAIGLPAKAILSQFSQVSPVPVLPEPKVKP